ncbi:MAG: protein translocase subunit SecD [Chromatiales bacterium]|nr:protein translocase subunit SecD [Chromatiales bacterium]
MINQYPLWKYLVIIVTLVIGVIYAVPNLYGDDPALQITANRMAEVDTAARDRVLKLLEQDQLPIKAYEFRPGILLVRFNDTDTQFRAYETLPRALGDNYTVAMNLASATPEWLRRFNALPMYLGLDLRGGVHFLMDIDMEAAVDKAVERYVGDIRTLLRDKKVRYLTITDNKQRVEIRFDEVEKLNQAREAISDELRELVLEESQQGESLFLYATLSESARLEVTKFALQQNITTLRKRVNELGVAEPVIQQQGENRIVVQLPGMQDPEEAKRMIGATATLEYHAVDEEHDVSSAMAGRVPFGSRLYKDRNGRPVLLKKSIIVSGDNIIDAASGLDSQTSQPMVSVTLDAQGAKRMHNFTKENVGKGMAVVYIETKFENRIVNGEVVKEGKRLEEVISIANVKEPFSKRFQTTGLDSGAEAHKLALLLRAGALAAPMQIVEERTIGPGAGQDNIDQGFQSVIIGFVLVLFFMVVWYRGFGMVANIALALNLVFLVAVLSMLQATLTLPGIAGIVLTVGMAVDANVLIFERIREELRNGTTPQAAIHAGYEKAFSTIADANITTLLAALVLYGFGTGPIKGFAITLSIGIITSMFTAIVVTRAVVNLAVNGKRLNRLSI